MKNFLSRLFICAGILFLISSFYLLYLRHSSHPLTFKEYPTKVVALSIETPNTIHIPSINVHLPIVPAVADKNKWETTEKGVSYLLSTPLPGDKGNSVMYGHNWTSLLKNLPQVRTGERVYVIMKDGTKREFKIEYTATVNADQTYIIDNTPDTRITIYTCVGFLDSKRFVVVAKPIT